jgi:hypothetical protein
LRAAARLDRDACARAVQRNERTGQPLGTDQPERRFDRTGTLFPNRAAEDAFNAVAAAFLGGGRFEIEFEGSRWMKRRALGRVDSKPCG